MKVAPEGGKSKANFVINVGCVNITNEQSKYQAMSFTWVPPSKIDYNIYSQKF